MVTCDLCRVELEDSEAYHQWDGPTLHIMCQDAEACSNREDDTEALIRSDR